MKTASSVLDASALLAYLKDEPGSDALEEAFRAAEKGELDIFMNQINLGEVFYIIAKDRSLADANFFFHERLPFLPIKLVPNLMADVIAAAGLKARLDLHYADAFATMTTMQRNATLVTTDRDFEKAADEIRIRWLR